MLSTGTRIKDIAYSGATGLVFINFSRVRSGIESDTIYCMDVMKNATKLSLSGVIDNMVILDGEKSMYYNGEMNNLYLHGKPFEAMKFGKLLGRDAEDRIYVQSLIDAHSISVIRNEVVQSEFTISTTNLNRFYSDGNGLYAIYDDYIIRMSDTIREKMVFDHRMRFMGAGGPMIYFWTPEGTITGRKWTAE